MSREVRTFTHARRYPVVIAKIGDKFLTRPIPAAQAMTAFFVFIFLYLSGIVVWHRLVGHWGLRIAIYLGLVYGASMLSRRSRPEGAPFFGWAVAMAAWAAGVVAFHLSEMRRRL